MNRQYAADVPSATSPVGGANGVRAGQQRLNGWVMGLPEPQYQLGGGFLYAIRSSTDVVKVGQTRNPRRRAFDLARTAVAVGIDYFRAARGAR